MNPYQKEMTNKEFLRTAYTLMKKKVNRLIEIEKSKKRNKLPLPLLKEKFEETSKILQSINLIGGMFDPNYSKEVLILLDIFNDFGILLGQANISDDSEEALKKYNICIYILEGFLEELWLTK